MGSVTSIFKSVAVFDLTKVSGNESYKITPVSSYGNCQVWKDILSKPDQCQIKKHGPIADLYGYIGYEFCYQDEYRFLKRVVLSTSIDTVPFGTGRSQGGSDTYVFRINDQGVFEVFVAPGMQNLTGRILQLFLDKALDTEVRHLLANAA